MQLETCWRMSVCFEIRFSIPYKDVTESIWAPSGVLVLLINQLPNLALKSPCISKKRSLLAINVNYKFLQVITKEVKKKTKNKFS